MVLKSFNPSFENGGYWEYYKDLERQFEHFLEVVPYLPGNEQTYSFRLANVLLSTGAYVDSALKEISKFKFFSEKYPEMLKPKTSKGKRREPNIKDFYPISEECCLYKKKVDFKCLPERDTISPFSEFIKSMNKKGKEIIACPYWWSKYNKVKHKFSDSFMEAKLKTVRDALSGAFLLNLIHEPSILRLHDYGILMTDYMRKGHGEPTLVSVPRHIVEQIITSKQSYPFIVETPLFRYSFDQ